MRNPYDHAYPPADWSVESLAAAITNEPTSSLPQRTNRSAWETIRSSGVCEPLVEEILDSATAATEEPLPDMRASVSLAYQRDEESGRTNFLNAVKKYQIRLTTVSLAECLQGDDRYLDDILDYAWAMCEWTSWVNPSNLWRGHDEETYEDGLPRVDPGPEHRTIELISARIGFQLAELDYLFGESLNPGLRERINREVERRLIQPYEQRDDYWWLDAPTNNWNAFCNTAALAATIYLVSDPHRVATILKKGIDSYRHYLNAFDQDGGIPEGINYWNAFGHYFMLADLIEARTDGDFRLQSVPIAQEIAKFPLRIELSPGRYPAFSDADERSGAMPYLAGYAGTHYEIDGLIALARRSLHSETGVWTIGALPETVRNLVWTADLPAVESPIPDRSNYFRGMQWWIVRADPSDPEAPVLAAKGGDNAESHNHNDCGSFVYHRNRESLLTDLGSANYSKEYFEADSRYEFLATRSLGHSVPYVNGYEQIPMEDATDREAGTRDRERIEPDLSQAPHAEVIERTSEQGRETFSLDLTDCYPEAADLNSLERRFEFARPTGQLELRDSATFESDPGTLESILISYNQPRKTDQTLTIEGDQADIVVETGDYNVTIERLEDGIVKTQPGMYIETEALDVWRTRIGPVAGQSPSIAVTVGPHTGN